MSVIQIKNTSFFEPTAIAGCQVWIDVPDSSTTVTSGNVSSIRNKTTNTTATLSSTLPTYNSSLINSLPGINFTGSSFIRGNFSSAYTGSNIIVFAVGSLNSTTNVYARLVSFSVPGSLDYNSVERVAPILRQLSNQALTSYRNGGELGSGTGITYNLNYLFCSEFTGSTYNFYLNGSNTSTTSSSGSFNVSAWGVGYLADYGGSDDQAYWRGNFGECIFYLGSLTTAQRQQVEGYLAWKWGLQGSLPSTHPFARSASFATSLYFPRAIPTVIGTTVKNPLAIQGIQLWLDAADTSSMTLSGSTVTQWRDKSGNGRNTTSYAGTPALTSNAINGVPAINFNGSSSFIGSIPGSGSSYTIFFIGTFNNSTGTYGGLLCFGRSGTPDHVSGITNTKLTDTSMYSTIDSTNTAFTSNSLSTPFIYSLVIDGTYLNSFVNGNQQTPTNIAKSPSFNFTNYVVGDRAGSTSSIFLNGFVGEIVVYINAITATQRQEVEGYLAWKWGLQGSLPVGHPYKLAAPAIVPYAVPVVRRITTIGSPVRIITTGLVSRWQLNESSGSTVIDSVGGNNITIGGSPSRVSVTYGSYTGFALSLQTTSQVGSISLPSNLNVVAHSMTSWLYLTALRSPHQRWLSWGNGSCSGGGEDFVCYLASSLYHGPSCIVGFDFINSGLTTGVWYFCASTYNGTTWTTYLNGTQIQSSNAGLSAVNGFFSIGYNQDSAQTLGGNGGGGYLGEIRFYNRALTAAEVLQIYQGTG